MAGLPRTQPLRFPRGPAPDSGPLGHAVTLPALLSLGGPRILTPFRRTARCTPDQVRCNRELAALRAQVEHPFRVLKRQFDFTKVRYRGLVKNTARLHVLFAVATLYLVRRRLLPAAG